MLDAMKDCVEEVKQQISEKIIRFIGGIDASLDANNFYESDMKMESVSQARSLLGPYCTKEIVDRLEAVKTRIVTVISQVVEKYMGMELNKYHIDPPRDLFDKFTQ